MKITKEGVVIFNRGEIVDFHSFDMEDCTTAQLDAYIREHYRYTPTSPMNHEAESHTRLDDPMQRKRGK